MKNLHIIEKQTENKTLSYRDESEISLLDLWLALVRNKRLFFGYYSLDNAKCGVYDSDERNV